MAKHTVKQHGQHKPTNRMRRATEASALSLAGLLAGAVLRAPPSQSAAPTAKTTHEDVRLAAASITFIDGHDNPYLSTRMANQITGQYQYTPACADPCTYPTTPTTSNFILINTLDQYATRPSRSSATRRAPSPHLMKSRDGNPLTQSTSS